MSAQHLKSRRPVTPSAAFRIEIVAAVPTPFLGEGMPGIIAQSVPAPNHCILWVDDSPEGLRSVARIVDHARFNGPLNVFSTHTTHTTL
jgi:hypothetical protein